MSHKTLTAFALVFNSGDCSIFPPVNTMRKIVSLIMREASYPPAATQRPVVANLRVSIPIVHKLIVGHVRKLVELELVRPTHLVHLVHMLYVLLEDVETSLLLLKVLRSCVVAPPPLVQVTQTLFSSQVLLLEFKALTQANNQS